MKLRRAITISPAVWVGLAALAAFATFAVLAALSLEATAPSTWASLSCLPCIAEALNNAYGIPGTALAAAAAAAATASVAGLGGGLGWGGLFGSGVLANQAQRDRPGDFRSPGERVETYVPGTSPLPDKGEVIYVPGLGASKVTNVYYDPDGFRPDGTPSNVVIETEFGSILVAGTNLSEQ